MKAFKTVLTLALLAALPAVSPAWAHVRVHPDTSKPGATEIYSMAVPTEGKVTTVKVDLTLPKGMTLVSVDEAGKPFDISHKPDGTTLITWTTSIEPSYAKIFKFTAKNPTGISEVAWPAHQYFADGTEADWVDVPGSKRPASITKLTP